MKNYVNIMQMTLDKIGELIEEGEQAPVCEHPMQARRDMSTMGHISWQCKICGYAFEQSTEEISNGEVRSNE